MKVLVTGHHGYIGSVLAPMLRHAGHDVVGLDTFYYRGCDFGDPVELEPALARDLRDVRPSDLDGFDAVVHLAALSNDPIGDLNVDWTYAINLEGTMILARAAKEAGVRKFVFASSCSMYGAAEGDSALPEEAPLRPLTPYAESKVRAEAALHELADDDFAPVAMRNATAYGVSPRLRLDIVLNNLTAWAHTTEAIIFRATARPGARSCTFETSPGRHWRCSTRPTRSFAARRSTSAQASRTTAFASSPRSCACVSRSAR